MSNAIKFSPPGGTIAVLARNTPDSVEIDVRDDGPGIDPADRERVFEPFYQGKQGADGLVKGTGIGLSVVREYVSEHGGSVEVVQDGRPQGALLRVRLPLKGRA
jgi:two-component system sensor histidine kinase GlrK